MSKLRNKLKKRGLERMLADLQKKEDAQIIAGQTGNYPAGKLNEQDEGELIFTYSIEKDKIKLDFGKPIAWLGFTLAEAEKLVNDLNAYIRKLKYGMEQQALEKKAPKQNPEDN